MTKHKTFNELLLLLAEFINLHKKIPSASSSNKTEKRLGNWCYQLRKKYRDDGSIEEMRRMTDTVISRVYNEPNKIMK